MNEVFRQYLRKFVLVFFDDILIYCHTVEDHVVHLRTVLDIMRPHKLYAKRSKCVSGTDKVKYLGHVISAMGVATDPSKVEAMSQWPVPTNHRYYRRFIQGYASISNPLTQLLKKNSFLWTNDSQTALPLNNSNKLWMSTPTQLKWLPKLMGFDYEIQYKKGAENVTADALSRLQSSSELLSLISTTITTDIYQRIVDSWKTNVKLQKWEDIHEYKPYLGLLQPLPMPTKIWSGISMDFIDSLPKSHDGQTEVVNRCLECYLRCMIGEQPKQWMKWLSLAEWWYNTNHHSAINTTPYEIVYGQSPPIHVPYVGGDIRVELVDRTLTAREEAI
ncbi:gypsy/ty3 retroelement polyprotein [Tanacetum coccineum]